MKYHPLSQALTRRALLLGALALPAFLTLPSHGADPTPLIHYTFEKSGEIVTDESGQARDAKFVSPQGAVGSVPTSEGVSGMALSLESAAGMGSGHTGPKLQFSSPQAMNLGSLASFTIFLWINPMEQPGNLAQLFTTFGIPEGLILGLPENQPQVYFQLAGETVIFPVRQPLLPDEWVLLALVYDSLAEDGQVQLYIGRASTESLEAVGAKDFPHGAWNAYPSRANWGFSLGNTSLPESGRPFKGLIDEFRLFGSESDSSGALSGEKIEQIFLKDLGR
jgi:hypothetical protein